MELPESVRELCPELFEVIPLDVAMNDLVVRRANFAVAQKVGEAVCLIAVAKNPLLVAGMWLYADDLEASHSVSQNISSAAGSWWHAIMHRREGDFWNSKYWYRQAQGHELMKGLGFDPIELVDRAEAGDARAVEWQRAEWAALMEWSVKNREGV